jgi:hypothetical protein
METLSPTLWDFRFGPGLLDREQARLAPSIPAPGRQLRLLPSSALSSATGDPTIADLTCGWQHRTIHLLIKPDILTCYQQVIQMHSRADYTASKMQHSMTCAGGRV